MGTVTPTVATWEDVHRIAMALPGATEGTAYGHRGWRVKPGLFAWERPLRARDRQDLGDRAPDGPVLGVRVEHLGAKEAVLAAEPHACFTIPHFDGYPAVLVRLDVVGEELLEELITESWLCRAPERAVRAHLDGRGA